MGAMRRSQLLALAVLCGLALMSASAQAAAPRAPAADQTTAALLENAVARSTPTANGEVVGRVADTRPLTGSQTVLPVIGRRTVRGHRWLRVRLPQRPDGATGWIEANGVLLGRTAWQIVVVRSRAHAYIYKAGKLVKSWPVVVGKPSTPTPSGHFFVAEVVWEGYGISTGPYALATSAYSNVYQEFEGGPGQVALHGRVDLPQPVGTASSHGCVRFDNPDIVWLAHRVRAGTPITIR